MSSGVQAARPDALLVIGVHREELAFGREVARELDPARVDVLEIPEGLSGRRPLPDARVRGARLHEALYRQLLGFMVGHYRRLIDLHAGFQTGCPAVDLFAADGAVRAALEHRIRSDPGLEGADIRLVALDGVAGLRAHTVIPPSVWHHPAFTYVGLEVYVPESPRGREHARRLARAVIHDLADAPLPSTEAGRGFSAADSAGERPGGRPGRPGTSHR